MLHLLHLRAIPAVAAIALLTFIPVQEPRAQSSALPVIDSAFPDYAQAYRVDDGGGIVTRVTTRGLFSFDNDAASHSYSKRQAWNADESLIDVGNRFINDFDSSVFHGAINLSSERNWSNQSSMDMIGFQYDAYRNRLIRYSLQDHSTELILDFDKIGDIGDCSFGSGEGNLSNDDQWVLVVCERHSGPDIAMSVNLPGGEITGTLELDDDYNWGGFSQSGQWILIEYSTLGNTTRRLVRYDQHLQSPTLISNTVEHGDFGIDDEGNDVYVMISDLGISYYRLHDRATVTIGYDDVGLGLGYGHVSCRNVKTPGSCVFSSLANDTLGRVALAIDYDAGVSTGDNSALAYTGRQSFEFWGRSRSSAGRYESQPRASASPSGRQAIFASDWFGRSDVNAYVVKRP